MAVLLNSSGRRFWVAALAIAVVWSLPVEAQSLGEVDAYLREGRLQDARSTLLEWETANPQPRRSERQRALWLRGLLTLDPEEASSSYARLIVEYPGGPFTDRALLRLALAADLRGDADEAAIHYAQLARDHPTSPLQDRAEEWLREHPEVTADAAGPLSAPSTAPSRGSGATGASTNPDPSPRTRAPGEDVGYTVQLGAFSDRRWADDLATRLQDAGFEARVVRVRNDALLRVRVGRYRTRAEAVVVRDEARAAGFEASLSTDAQRETSGG